MAEPTMAAEMHNNQPLQAQLEHAVHQIWWFNDGASDSIIWKKMEAKHKLINLSTHQNGVVLLP